MAGLAPAWPRLRRESGEETTAFPYPCNEYVCVDVSGEVLYNLSNVSVWGEVGESSLPSDSNWEALFLLLIVAAGILGNVLVCVAIKVEKKLRNVTNYFLMSLAIADLLVSLIVMPCSIVHEFMGKFL